MKYLVKYTGQNYFSVIILSWCFSMTSECKTRVRKPGNQDMRMKCQEVSNEMLGHFAQCGSNSSNYVTLDGYTRLVLHTNWHDPLPSFLISTSFFRVFWNKNELQKLPGSCHYYYTFTWFLMGRRRRGGIIELHTLYCCTANTCYMLHATEWDTVVQM